MWLGPAPAVPYDPDRCLYHFRWFNDYSGGQTTNLLAHEIDIVQWVTDAMPGAGRGLRAAAVADGLRRNAGCLRRHLRVPEFPGELVEPRGVGRRARRRPRVLWHKGHAAESTGEDSRSRPTALSPESQIPRVSFSQQAASDDPVTFRTEAVKDEGYEQVRDQFRPHVRNFLDCVKSRQAPVADLAGAHQTSIACHLANICAARSGASSVGTMPPAASPEDRRGLTPC